MDKEERKKKIEELTFELVKAKAGAAKSGSSKAKEVKKMIEMLEAQEKDIHRKEIDKKNNKESQNNLIRKIEQLKNSLK